MDEIAAETGGKTCKNTNDLSGCVIEALNDSSSYYELAFYPEGVNWDGTFHRIHLKTTRHGVDLDYRRGYFASDAETAGKPDERLQQACADWLPSNSIALTAQRDLTSPPKPGQIRYLLAISPAASHFAPSAETVAPSLRLGICQFNEKAGAFQMYATDLQSSQTRNAREVRGLVDVSPQPDTRRVRFEVIDLNSGQMGGLDVPVRPEDRAGPPPPPSPPPAGTGPAPTEAATAPRPSTVLDFNSSTGKSGLLDWGGDKVVYHGDLPSEAAAQALFQKSYQPRYHCASGVLTPIDPAGSPPKLRFSLQSSTGKSVEVNMSGKAAEFSGDLPVDDSAKVFFQHLWGLCHCQNLPSPPK
jgi:hypothetical protein